VLPTIKWSNQLNKVLYEQLYRGFESLSLRNSSIKGRKEGVKSCDLMPFFIGVAKDKVGHGLRGEVDIKIHTIAILLPYYFYQLI